MKTIENIGILKLDELQTGDVILVDSNSFLANAIHEFQGNRFNHAAFFVKKNGLKMVYEAVRTGSGFNLFSNEFVEGYSQDSYYFDEYLNNEIDILVLRLKKNIWPNIDKVELDTWLSLHDTDGYAFRNLLYWQAVKYAWKWITGKEKWIGRDLKKRYICGQLVAKIYNQFMGVFPNWVKFAPVDLFESDLFNHYKLSKT